VLALVASLVVSAFVFNLFHSAFVKELVVQSGPNPSIERTSQRPLRALCAAAHVELQGLPPLSSK
jgi:hypothetical protein